MNKFIFAFFPLSLLLLITPLFSNQLHNAVKQADVSAVEQILQKNPEIINEADLLGKTAMHYAALLDINYDTLENFFTSKATIHGIFFLLRKNGGDFYKEDNSGNIPIYYALEQGNVVATGALVHFGRDNLCNRNYFTLHIEKYMDDVRALIKNLFNMKELYAHDSFEHSVLTSLIQQAEGYLEYVRCGIAEKKILCECMGENRIYTHMIIFEYLPPRLAYMKEYS